MRKSDRFPELVDQDTLDAEFRRRKNRDKRAQHERTAFLFSCLLIEITVLVWIAAQHPAWPL